MKTGYKADFVRGLLLAPINDSMDSVNYKLKFSLLLDIVLVYF